MNPKFLECLCGVFSAVFVHLEAHGQKDIVVVLRRRGHVRTVGFASLRAHSFSLNCSL